MTWRGPAVAAVVATLALPIGLAAYLSERDAATQHPPSAATNEFEPAQDHGARAEPTRAGPTRAHSIQPDTAPPAVETTPGARLQMVDRCDLVEAPVVLARTSTSTSTKSVHHCPGAAEATAAVVAVTVRDAESNGALTVWGAGARPDATTATFEARTTNSSTAIVALNDNGTIEVSADTTAAVTIQLTGIFVDEAPTRAGRLVPMAPQRLWDSRGRHLEPGTHQRVRVALPALVAPDASAVVVTVTSIDTTRDGVISSRAGNEDWESAVNVVGGETRSSTLILPVSPDGFEVLTTAGGDLVVDFTAWFTGPSAAASTDGLFIAAPRMRLHDSKAEDRQVAAGGTREIAVPRDASAWMINLAVTTNGTSSSGNVVLLPARTQRPATSTLKTEPDATSSNWTIIGATTHGLAAYSTHATDLVVDASGWFTGTPLRVDGRAAPDPRPPRRVLVIGDSSSAGIRWNSQAASALRGAEYTLDLESCRRLASRACRGREGYRPHSVLEVLRSQQPGQFDTLIIAAGYNDLDREFSVAFDQIMAAAEGLELDTVIWATYREEVGYGLPNGAGTSYRAMNEHLMDAHTAGVHPLLRVVDWGSYSAQSTEWFNRDGVHTTRRGTFGLADYLTRTLAAIDGRPCPIPWNLGETPESPCPEPDSLIGQRPVPPIDDLYP